MNERPTDRLAIAVAQLDPTVGDIAGNADKAGRRAPRRRARAPIWWRCRSCSCPAIRPRIWCSSRPCRPPAATRSRSWRGRRRRRPRHVDRDPWVESGKLYNAYCLLDRGLIAALRFKVDLPNYGVFDEKRVFSTGPMPGPVNFRGVRLGLPICEDIWGTDVVETLAETGAELLIVPNGSPYWRNKETTRLNIAVARVTESDLPLIYVNEVGGQDELIFDGASFALHADCSLAFQLPAFRESVTTVRWQRTGNGWRCLEGPMAKPERKRAGRLFRLRAGLARLCGQERLCGRGAGTLGRRRFRAVRRHRGRCAGRQARALRDAALSLHLAGIPRRRRVHRTRAGRAVRHRSDRKRGRRPRAGAGAAVRGRAPRRHRGEPAGAGARRHLDGDLQQARPDGGDHRQQIGDVGRLRHPLRRHERRLQSDQGSLQDRGLPPGAPAQRLRARTARSGPAGR